VDDLVRGTVEFPLSALEDFVCVRGDGTPLFALANAVDDRTMAMTHVIRGEDLLPSTPRQVLLWRALDRAEGRELPLPSYAHLPLLVNEQGKKLSKRRDPVAVELYRERGYLPVAFRNYLALLGWSPGDEEILPVETLIERFALEDVQKSPAFFDVKKLSHFNGVYIRMLSVPEFIEAARPWVDPVAGEWAPGSWIDPDTGEPVVAPVPWAQSRYDELAFAELAGVTQEWVAVLSEVPALVDFLFLEDAPIDDASWQKAIAGDEAALQILTAAHGVYADCPWDKDTLHDVTLEIAEAAGRKLGKAQAPIRVAVMGRTTGLPLFDSLAALGREETRRRIAAALARLAPAA
jgi:glutamyl-tRNA synthetase